MDRNDDTPALLPGLLAGLLILGLGIGCGERVGASSDGGHGATSGGSNNTNPSNANSSNTNPSNTNTTPGNNDAHPDDSPLASGVPEGSLLSDLSDSDLGALCDAVGALESQHDAELRDFRCLALALDGAALATDPTFTCDRVRGICDLLPLDQESISDTCQQEVRDTDLRSHCRPVTVAEFEACVVDNLALELAVAPERGAMMCAEAVTWDHILPDGTMDCACGRPLQLGPPPEQDPDRDNVLTDDDRCPETEPFAEVNVHGCSERQDSDQDGVPNHLDACPETEPDPVDLTENGCSFRQRDQDDDGVLDTHDLCGDTEPGADVDSMGCSARQDEDSDTVPNHLDACPGTEVGAAIAPNGCSARQDEDGDAVPNHRDDCPLTPAGAAVDALGCTEEQHDALGDPTLDALPDGAVTFVLAEDSPAPTRLAAMPSSVTEFDEGVHIEGTLLLQVPQDGSYMVLPNADVLLTYGDTPSRGLYEISGEVEAPFPNLGWFAGAEMQTPRATIGFAPGSSDVFAGLRVPLEDARWYLWCTFDTTLGVSLGPLEFQLHGNDDFRFVLDLADPFFAAQGDVSNLGFFGPVRNAALAFSN